MSSSVPGTGSKSALAARIFTVAAGTAVLAFGAITLLGSIQAHSPMARVTERLVKSGKYEVLGTKWEPTWRLDALEDAPWNAQIQGALQAGDLSLDDHVLVVNLWASWCPPCRNELPGMMKLSRKLKTLPVRFVFVTYDDTWDAPTKLLKELFGGMPQGVAHFRDPLGKAGGDQHPDTWWMRLGATALPETFFVKDGTVVGKIVGEINWEHPDIEEYLRLVAGG